MVGLLVVVGMSVNSVLQAKYGNKHAVVENNRTLAKSIVGSWYATGSLLNGAGLEKQTTYNANGTLAVHITLNHNGDITTIDFSGTWLIMDGMLVSTITSSNRPEMAPIGTKEANKIVSITAYDLTYIKSSNGETIVESRVK